MTTVFVTGTATKTLISALVSGGSTISANSGMRPTWGYAVAARDSEEFTLPPHNDDGGSWRDDIEAYIRRHMSRLAQSGTFLGSWLDPESGYIVLDIVEVIADLDRALEVAKQRGERAIFNLSSQETVYVS